MRIEKKILTALHKLASEDFVRVCNEFGHKPEHSHVCKEQMELCNDVCQMLHDDGGSDAKFITVSKYGNVDIDGVL
jgi:hypothetical protein